MSMKVREPDVYSHLNNFGWKETNYYGTGDRKL